MKRNNKLLNKAIEIASFLKEGKFRHCSIITDKRNKILSIGLNSFSKTSPLQKRYAEKVGEKDKIFNHSEIDALRKIPYNSNPYNIYIARINKHNKPLLSKPCRICKLALKEFKIKNVFHT